METLVTPDHRAQMDTRGYTLFPDLFTAAQMDALDVGLSGHDARLREDLAVQGGQSGITRADEIAFTDHIAERDPAVAAFCQSAAISEISTAFLGPDVDVYWNQSVYKNPEGERVFPWHQDDAYGPVTPAPYLTLWIAVSDAREDMGCISVLAGSHRGGLRPHSKSPIGLVGHAWDDPDQGVMVPVTKGTMIAFWSLTLHKSGANVSKEMRKAFVLQPAPIGLRMVDTGEPAEMTVPIARGGRPVV